MKMKKLIILSSLIILFGCSFDKENHSPPGDITNISTRDSFSQKKADHAIQFLLNDDRVTHAYAVNSKNKMIVAVEVPHLKRLRLQKIKQQLTDKLKKEFPDLDLSLSTDKKIVIELKKLQNKINSGTLSKKEIQKKMQTIIDLSKEET